VLDYLCCLQITPVIDVMYGDLLTFIGVPRGLVDGAPSHPKGISLAGIKAFDPYRSPRDRLNVDADNLSIDSIGADFLGGRPLFHDFSDGVSVQ